MKKEHVSVIIVNFNGKKYLEEALSTIGGQEYDKDAYDVIMVDNGSNDGSVSYVRAAFPEVKVIQSDKNNFAHACNLGVKAAPGEYVLLANNDMSFHPLWLRELVRVLNENPEAAGVQSKLLLADGTVNSLGVEEVSQFYFKDIGFREKNDRSDALREVDYICGGSSLYRKELLERSGLFDEDFIMYVEDVEMSYRLRRSGYKLLVNPTSVAYHAFGGTSNTELTSYFCSRNRYGFIAKHHPEHFIRSIDKCHYFIQNMKPEFYTCFKFGLYKLYKEHPGYLDAAGKAAIKKKISSLLDKDTIDSLFRQVECFFSLSRPKVGIFDQVIHLIGGGQKLNAQIARCLQDKYDVSMMGLKDFDLAEVKKRDGIDIDKCRYVKIDIGYEKNEKADLFDSNMIAPPMKNYYEAVSLQSSKYDIFINGNMVPQIRPRSPYSVFFCHFPDITRTEYFYVGDYSKILVNSSYTERNIEEKWRLKADSIVYPPVDSFFEGREKKNIILSLARFETGGTKKQLEMVRAFEDLCRTSKDISGGWTLHLVGGSVKSIFLDKLEENVYLEKLKAAIQKSRFRDSIFLHVNAPFDEVKKIVSEAKIFWHLCGLGESEPRNVEHFGMAIVESMQNRCVPVIFNGGGQKEILSANGQGGYLINNISELKSVTLKLIASPERLAELAEQAFERSKSFSYERFARQISDMVAQFKSEFQKVINLTVQDEMAEIKKARMLTKYRSDQPVHMPDKGHDPNSHFRFEYALNTARMRADVFRLVIMEARSRFERVMKKIIHLPIRFYTFRQSAYNDSMIEAVSILSERVEHLTREIERMDKMTRELTNQNRKLRDLLDVKAVRGTDGAEKDFKEESIR